MLLLAGLVGLFVLDTPWNVIVVCVAAVIEVGEVAFWLRWQRRRRVQTGAEGMVGETGEVIELFADGEGRVRVLGEIWAARASAPLAQGTQVSVTSVEGLTLAVEPTEKGP